MTIAAATEEIRVIVNRGVDALRATELYPVDQVTRYPLAVVFPQAGTLKNGPPENMTGLHNINVMLIYPLEPGLQQSFERVTPLIDSVGTALWDALRAGEIGSAAGANSVIQTWQDITYTVEDRSIAGSDYLVVVLVVNQVKIQTALA
jgi:hypothetical protein